MSWEKIGSDIVITPCHVFTLYAILILTIGILIKLDEREVEKEDV